MPTQRTSRNLDAIGLICLVLAFGAVLTLFPVFAFGLACAILAAWTERDYDVSYRLQSLWQTIRGRLGG